MVVEKIEFDKDHFVIRDWEIRNVPDGYEKLANFCLNDLDFLYTHSMHLWLSTKELIIANLKKDDLIGFSVRQKI